MPRERTDESFVFSDDKSATPASVRQTRSRILMKDDITSTVSRRRTSKKRSASPLRAEQKQSPKVSRRSSCSQIAKRRSSFVRGRVSRQSVKSSQDLLQSVPNTLPEPDRCAALLENALQHTLVRLNEEEFNGLDGMQQFTVEVNEVIGSLIQKMKQNGSFAEACSVDGIACNRSSPEENEADKQIQRYEKTLEKMKQETDAWEETLRSRTQKAEEAQKAAEDIQSQPLSAIPEGLSVSQQQLLSSKPDFNKLIEDLNFCQDKVILQVEELSKAARTLQCYEDSAGAQITHHIHKFGTHSFEGIQNFDKPELLLQNILS